jgi:hypothetical protein
MALGSTEPVAEMSTRDISWGGKGGGWVGLTTLPPSSADCLEILVASTSWNPQDLSRPVMELLYLGFLNRYIWLLWLSYCDWFVLRLVKIYFSCRFYLI